MTMLFADIEQSGFFRCRFSERADIEGLGKLIQRYATAGHMPYFNIAGATPNSIAPQKVAIDERTLGRMTASRGLVPPFRMREVTIRSSNRAAKTSILLCFTEGTSFPISGFPRYLHDDLSDYPSSPGRPKLKAMGSIRWASRTGSQRQRRFDWKPPTLLTPVEREDVIARYSDVSHLLGSATSLTSLTDSVHEMGHSPRERPIIRALDVLNGLNPRSARPSRLDVPMEQLCDFATNSPQELPAIEVRHELPATEEVYELPNTEASVSAVPEFWMADEDWADTEPRGPESIYMSLTCGDKVRVLEMPTDGLNGSIWRVVRPSDGREGWVPSHCLRPLEDATPRRQRFDASPIEGVFW